MAEKVVAVTLTARTAPYIAQMAAAAKATGAVGTQAARANVAAQPMGRSLRNAARATDILNPKLLGAAGLVFGLKSVVSQAARFEDEFAMVRKTMSGTDEVLDQVALNIREMATDMPVTTTELNRIATVAGQLGIPAEDVSHFTETIAQLSVTTNMTAEQAAIDFARFSNIIGKPIDEVDELGNVIVHLGNNMAAEETEIMEFAKRIAGVGTQMGMTESEILALSAALPALGLRAEMGGTAITRIMVEVNKAVTEGGEKLGIFAEAAGMTAEQFSRAWKDDPSNTLLEFTAGIGQMSDEGADAFATIADLDLSMIRTQDTALRLAGGTEQYTNALALANEEMENQSANQIEWDKRMETTMSQFGILKNNVREAAIEIGGPLNEALGDTLRVLNDIWDGRPEGGIAGAIAEAMPGGTLFGQDPMSGEDRNLLEAAIAAFQRGVDPGGEARDFFMSALSARAEQGRQGLADNEARHLQAMSTQGEQYVAGLTGRDLRQEDHLAAMAAQADQYVDGLLRAAAASAESAPDFSSLSEAIGTVPDRLLRAEMKSWDYTSAAGELEGSVEAVAESFVIAEEGLANYQDTLRAATDPVFALNQAVKNVDEAQAAYDATMKDSKATQAEVEQAAWELVTAQAALEQAAIDGDLEFGEFERQLDRWVAMGKITADEADIIRDRVKDLREEAEDYDDQYVANMVAHTETAEERIRRVRNLIAQIPARIRTEVFVTVDPESDVNKRIAASGGTIFAAHTGGYIHPDGSIQRFHGGGMVGGLARDEVPAVLQTGEMVLSRADVSQLRAAITSERGGLTVQQTFNGDVSRTTLAEARHQQRLAFLEAV